MSLNPPEVAGDPSAQPSWITLDIETTEMVENWDKTSQCKFACVSIWDHHKKVMKTYAHDQSQEVLDLVEACMEGGKVVTWNGHSFDLPVIYGMDRQDFEDMIKSRSVNHVDLRRLCLDAIGFSCRAAGFGLQSTAMATLGLSKSGKGEDAPALFQQGRTEELNSYCEKDVEVTHKLYEHAWDHGWLKCVMRGEEYVAIIPRSKL